MQYVAGLVITKVQSSISSQAWGLLHTYVTRIYEIQMVGTVCNECLGEQQQQQQL